MITWIPCAERMPARDQVVLVCFPEPDEDPVYFCAARVVLGSRAEAWWDVNEGDLIEEGVITHWAELNPPPKELT